MPENPEDFTLPKAPKDLCFNENDFNKSNFSVDVFLQEHRRRAGLETMRDDLGMYLKVLRSAMIELINKDYADFVNLSSNLIGLDRAINDLQAPLGQLREEVMHVRQTLDAVINELEGGLDERRRIRERKQSLQSLACVHNSIAKLSQILIGKCTDDASGEATAKLEPDLLERAATEFNRLKFHISRCKLDLAPAQDRKCSEIGGNLMGRLDVMFLSGINEKDPELLVRSLRIYVTLDKIADAERLLRKKVIGPALENVVNEASLQSEPQGLHGIYQRVLSILNEDLAQLLTVTLCPDRMSVKGFNFLVNSFWPELEERIEVHLTSIFAPGNPELFYRQYHETLEFLSKLEECCGTQETLLHLKNHPRYNQFLKRWNLPVYFQIRFQEIAGSVEAVLYDCISPTLIKKNINVIGFNDFSLHTTSIVWECLLRTWADGVFLPQLLHRFWKLSIQIYSRYQTWCLDALKQVWPVAAVNDTINVIEAEHPDRLQFLVSLYKDIEKLIKEMPSFMKMVCAKVTILKPSVIEPMKDCLKESESKLEDTLPMVTKEIVTELMSQSVVHLKQVSDIPRLFRRTNREVPTKACAYVGQVVNPLAAFHTDYNAAMPDLVTKWLELTLSSLTEQYLLWVTDVLTSVQKTEESLRRLKKIRDKSIGMSPSEGKGIGDDEKIRIQLEIDVHNYNAMIEGLGVAKSNVSNLLDLTQVVEEALKTKNEGK